MRRIWLLLLGLGVPLVALATRRPPPSQPYYAYGVYNKPLVADLPSAYLAEPVVSWLKGEDIAQVVYRAPDGSRAVVWPRWGRDARLQDVPAVALKAIIDVMRREQPGVYADLLVQQRGGERYPVSVRWSLDNTLHVALGAPVAMEPAATHTAAAVSERWGLRLLTEGAARWDQQSLHLLDTTMSLLTDAERACVSDVPIVASDAPPPSKAGTRVSGIYEYSSTTTPHIRLYTRNADPSQTTFFGDVDAPVPFGVHLVLHELAHAIADASARRAWAPLLAPRQRYHALMKQATEVADVSADGRIRLGPAHLALAQQLQEAEQALLDLGWSPARESAIWNARRRLSAPELAWAQRMGDRWRPTRYGELDDKEGFAEFFALAHSDPAVIRAIAPDMTRWFAAEGHLDCAPARSTQRF